MHESHLPLLSDFVISLTSGVNALHHLIHHARELNWRGEHDTDRTGDDMPHFFHSSSQFERPREFLDSWLDMLRVLFEPNPPGTMFLNSNPDFILDNVPNESFRLAYMSRLGAAAMSAPDLLRRAVDPCRKPLGFDTEPLSPNFVAICFGAQPSLQEVSETLCQLGAGLTAEDLSLQSRRPPTGATELPEVTSFAGFCVDAALGDRRRISMWRFVRSRALC